MTTEEQLAAAKARIVILEEVLRQVEEYFGETISVVVMDGNGVTGREPLLKAKNESVA